MKQQIEIYNSKKIIKLFLIVSTVFLITGLAFVFINPAYMLSVEWIEMRLANWGYILIAVFSIVEFIFIQKLLSSKPALIIDTLGVWRNSGEEPMDKLLWENVVEIKKIKIRSSDFIGFVTNNTQEIMDAETSLYKKSIYKINIKKYGSPFIIPVVLLETNVDELYSMLQLKMNEVKVSKGKLN